MKKTSENTEDTNSIVEDNPDLDKENEMLIDSIILSH